MLLPAVPAEAGWLGRGLGVAGAARSLKRNLGEAVDLLDDTLGAAIQGDFDEVERLSGELREVPGRIITDAFPAVGVGAAALEKADAAGDWLNAARRRVGRFVSDAVADDRMALEAGKYEIEAGVLDPKRPLPAVTLSGPAGAKPRTPSGSGAASAPDPWGQEPEEDEETATDKPDPWGQDPEDEEVAAANADPSGEDGRAGREGGDIAADRLQGEYAAALDRYLSAEEGSSDYESTLSVLLEREKELLAGVAGPEEQELTPDERRRVQACLAEREFDPGSADGIFGPRTRTAIRAWQASQGREESGRLDQSSARTLLEECEVVVAEAETTEEPAAGTETAKTPVERTFEPKCADIFNGRTVTHKVEIVLVDPNVRCYLEFVDKPGCHFAVRAFRDHSDFHKYILTDIKGLIFFPGKNFARHVIDKPRWSGDCSGGVPNGRGTVTVSRDEYSVSYSLYSPHEYPYYKIIEWTKEWTGQFVDGVPQGDWTTKSRSLIEFVRKRGPDPQDYTRYKARYSKTNCRLHGEITAKVLTGDSAGRHHCASIVANFVNGEVIRGSKKRTRC